MYQYLILKSYCCIFPLFIEAEEKKKRKKRKGSQTKYSLISIVCNQFQKSYENVVYFKNV